jgi:2-polyprenyl-3-methyl-5-hydroxy-6-metoxy-1,4-benzoquinol methylase
MDMHRTKTHEMLARQTPDDVTRAQFIVGLKRYMRAMTKGNETTYATRAEPRFRARHGRSPATIEEIGTELERESYYQIWSALTRAAQDMMWQAVESTIEHDMPRMRDAAHRLSGPGSAKGSLSLDPGFVPPADVLVADIHCQPGGYMRDQGDGDIMAGALYESGGNVYSSGVGIGQRDSKAGAVIGFLSERFPDLRPKRILDLGCSAGSASVAYAAMFPHAEVHAVDAGPAILRYAHARAEALGVAVHFHQMNVGQLEFADGSFDLVVSHNLMHEISRETMARLFAESHRVLRPGGIALHQDVPIRGDRTLLERYMFAWETKYNNEPFWQVFAEADVRMMLTQASFAPDSITETQLSRLDGPGMWYVALAEKSAQA